MNEQVKKKKRIQKRARHEATKKRTRKHKMAESTANAKQGGVLPEVDAAKLALLHTALTKKKSPGGTEENNKAKTTEKHEDFMSKKRR